MRAAHFLILSPSPRGMLLQRHVLCLPRPRRTFQFAVEPVCGQHRCDGPERKIDLFQDESGYSGRQQELHWLEENITPQWGHTAPCPCLSMCTPWPAPTPAPMPAMAVGLVLAEGTQSTLPELSSVLLCFHFLSWASPSPTRAPACWSGWGMQRGLSCPGQDRAHGPVPSEPSAADRCLSEPSWGCQNGPAKP